MLRPKRRFGPTRSVGFFFNGGKNEVQRRKKQSDFMRCPYHKSREQANQMCVFHIHDPIGRQPLNRGVKVLRKKSKEGAPVQLQLFETMELRKNVSG